MSTLEQLLEMGREEGREEGLYKNRIFNLLRTVVHFPDWPAAKLADFTELELETVDTFLRVRSQEGAAALLDYVLRDLLADIPLSAEEREKLARLTEELSAGKE